MSGRCNFLRHAPAAGGDGLDVGDRRMNSDHRRRGLADGEQRVAHHAKTTEPGSTVRYVPHAP